MGRSPVAIWADLRVDNTLDAVCVETICTAVYAREFDVMASDVCGHVGPADGPARHCTPISDLRCPTSGSGPTRLTSGLSSVIGKQTRSSVPAIGRLEVTRV